MPNHSVRNVLRIGAVSVGTCLATTGMPALGADGSDAPNAAPAAGPRLSSEMAALSPRIGRWRVVIRTLPDAEHPHGGVDNGLAVMTAGPGGHSIVQDFSSAGFSGDTVGQSTTWWDAGAQTYKSIWCDNQQGCVEFATSLAGDIWTVRLDGEANGRRTQTVIRATMNAAHDAIHEEVSTADDDGPARTVVVSDYARVADGDAAEVVR